MLVNDNENNIIRVAIVGDGQSGQVSFIDSVRGVEKQGDRTFDWIEVKDIESLPEVRPDVTIMVMDALKIEKSLIQATHLIDMHLKIVMALNHYDDLRATDHDLDYNRLGLLLGFRVVPTDTCSGKGIEEVVGDVVAAYTNERGATRHTHVIYGNELERAIDNVETELVKEPELCQRFNTRHLAIHLLEDPYTYLPKLQHAKHLDSITSAMELNRSSLIFNNGVQPAVLINNARQGFVTGALTDTLVHSKNDTDHTLSQRIDKVLTSPWTGFPILIAVLFLVFQCTFAIGAYPQDWIATVIDALCAWIKGTLPGGWLTSLFVDGVVQGVGSVLAFVPQIMIMFFFIALMEESGYMSRAAFLMDKIMHKVGLHGRSFIPMLIGFGCNVPAIMAARNIDDVKDRMLTMLMIPFMSCSARLPVYMLLVSAFFDPRYQALVMMSLYVLGVVLSILFALVMKHTRWFRKQQDDFVSELPSFRQPTWRNVWGTIWERTSDYLQKIATVILWASIIIWALEFFPRNEDLLQPLEDKIANVQTNDQLTESEKLVMVSELESECSYIQNENSYLAMIGKFIEPVMRPLGFDWRLNVCILTGLPAKEAIVSTMGILYHVDETDGDSNGKLVDSLKKTSHFSPLVAYGFMVFVLLYFPCIATIATLRREVGKGWAWFVVVHSMLLAWLMAFIVNMIGTIF